MKNGVDEEVYQNWVSSYWYLGEVPKSFAAMRDMQEERDKSRMIAMEI